VAPEPEEGEDNAEDAEEAATKEEHGEEEDMEGRRVLSLSTQPADCVARVLRVFDEGLAAVGALTEVPYMCIYM